MDLALFFAYVVGVMLDPILWAFAWIFASFASKRWQAVVGGVFVGLLLRLAVSFVSQRYGPFNYWDGALAAGIAGALAAVIIFEMTRFIRRRHAAS